MRKSWGILLFPLAKLLQRWSAYLWCLTTYYLVCCCYNWAISYSSTKDVLTDNVPSLACRQAAKDFVGHHDFKQFSSMPSVDPPPDPMKTMLRVDILDAPGGYSIEIEGSGFLYNQCRHMVGCLISIGLGTLPVTEIARLLKIGSSQHPGEQASKRSNVRVAAWDTSQSCAFNWLQITQDNLIWKECKLRTWFAEIREVCCELFWLQLHEVAAMPSMLQCLSFEAVRQKAIHLRRFKHHKLLLQVRSTEAGHWPSHKAYIWKLSSFLTTAIQRSWCIQIFHMTSMAESGLIHLVRKRQKQWTPLWNMPNNQIGHSRLLTYLEYVCY